MVVSLRLATLHECSTVYGLKDVFDLLDIAEVDAHNRRILSDANK